MLGRLVGPPAVSLISQAIAKNVAGKQPNPRAFAATYARTLRVCGILTIFVALVYATLSVYFDKNTFNSGKGIYKLLNISPGASLRQISQGFRQSSRLVHPDKNPEKAGAYEVLSAANEILKDRELRFIYDRFGIDVIKHFEKVLKADGALGQIVSTLFIQSLWFWALNGFGVAVSALITGNTSALQMILVLAFAGIELTLITREFYAWYLPLPIFQVVRIMRMVCPYIVGSISFIIPAKTSPLDHEIQLLDRSVSEARTLAAQRLENVTEPFKSDEIIMNKLMRVANGATTSSSAP